VGKFYYLIQLVNICDTSFIDLSKLIYVLYTRILTLLEARGTKHQMIEALLNNYFLGYVDGSIRGQI
jgi:hypothetical protein